MLSFCVVEIDIELPDYELVLKTIGGASVTYLSFKLVRYFYRCHLINAQLAAKHEQLKLDRECLIKNLSTTPNELNDLWEVDVSELLKRLHSHSLKPCDLLKSFQKRVVNLLPLNCVAEVLADAEERAIAVSNSTPTSAIYGLPVSCKENIQVKGYDSTCGLVRMTGQPALTDSVLVKVLKHAGAVPFVTTTMAPTGMSMDSSSEIYGLQRNPLDPKRLAGGSSGGCGILVASGGSPLSFGTDIGGSVRIPAAFCGNSALKPTSSRISCVGLCSVARLFGVHFKPVIGPMAKRVDTLVDAVRSVWVDEMFRLDNCVAPIPFRENIYSGEDKKSLTIGYYTSFGEIDCQVPTPSVQRAVLKAKLLLEQAGYTLVEFKVPNVENLTRLLFRGLFAEGGSQMLKICAHEPLNARMYSACATNRLPTFIRRTMAFLASRLYSPTVGTIIYGTTGCDSVLDVITTLREIQDFAQTFANAWVDQSLDALICPLSTTPAPLASMSDFIMAPSFPYAMLYNMLDYPAGVLPISKVTQDDIAATLTAEKNFRNRGDRLSAAMAGYQTDTIGLPVAVQVVARPLLEERVLRIMQQLEHSVLAEGY